LWSLQCRLWAGGAGLQARTDCLSPRQASALDESFLGLIDQEAVSSLVASAAFSSAPTSTSERVVTKLLLQQQASLSRRCHTWAGFRALSPYTSSRRGWLGVAHTISRGKPRRDRPLVDTHAPQVAGVRPRPSRFSPSKWWSCVVDVSTPLSTGPAETGGLRVRLVITAVDRMWPACRSYVRFRASDCDA